MSNETKNSQSSGDDNSHASYGTGYGYRGYSNYGGGYYGSGYNPGGYGGGEENLPQRNIKDYLLIFRERIWYFIIAFFIVFTGTLLYTFNTTEEYRSLATIQVLRDDLNVMGLEDMQYNTIASAEDFNTQVRIIQSMAIIDGVAERIKGKERERFLAPYQGGFSLSGPMSLKEILVQNRNIQPLRLTMIINIIYSHPDPDVAARIANYFADEYINYNVRLNIDTSMRAIEDLRIRADQQRNKVEGIRNQLVDYRHKTGRTSLNQEENIENQELLALNQASTDDKRYLDIAQTEWDFVQQSIEQGLPLTDLPFIADMPQVSNLLSQQTQQSIELGAMQRRYRAKHPNMIELKEAGEQIDQELSIALDSAVKKIKSNYERALRNYEHSEKSLELKESEILDLNRVAVEYRSIEDDLEVNNSLYQAMMHRLEAEMADISLQGASSRIIDNAVPSIRPFKPNILMNLALGTFGGIAIGLGLVVGLAFLDDRVKSAFDIEIGVGVPLIGILPRIKGLNSPDKARIVTTNGDQRITEAFRAIHSALKVNEMSKKAKVIVLSSTSPSEGKTFVSTNMAFTYAMHGEKTIVVDCDLRVPNIAKSLSIETDKGLIQVIDNECELDDAICKNVYPNLDILNAGGKTANPTQKLHSAEFEQTLAQLTERYDRIIVDSPPIAAVSDLLIILPHCDGLLYVVKFNAVKKKNIKVNMRRIIESNTPVFGVIMNQISITMASYYYSNYYDKTYRSYYTKGPIDEPKAAQDTKTMSTPV